MSERNILPPFSGYVTSHVLNMETVHSTKKNGNYQLHYMVSHPRRPRSYYSLLLESQISFYWTANIEHWRMLYNNVPTQVCSTASPKLFRTSVLSKRWQHRLLCSHFILGTCTELTVTYVSYYHLHYAGSNNKYLIFLSMHLNVYEHVLFTEVWWL